MLLLYYSVPFILFEFLYVFIQLALIMKPYFNYLLNVGFIAHVSRVYIFQLKKDTKTVLQKVYFEDQHCDRKSFILSLRYISSQSTVRKFFHPAGGEEEGEEEEEEEASASSQLSSRRQQTFRSGNFLLPGKPHCPAADSSSSAGLWTHGESTELRPALRAAWPERRKKNPRGLLLSLLAVCGSSAGVAGLFAGET